MSYFPDQQHAWLPVARCGEGARSYFMDVDPTARDAERGIFDAAWTA